MNIIFTTLNTLLGQLFKVTGDWGLAIILLTIMIRTLLLPLSIKQRNSSEKNIEMSKKIKEIQIKYKNDKKRLEKEMQDIYSQNLNGFKGVLPLIIQLPIMFTLPRVFAAMTLQVGSIIVPWVVSLKVSDPYFIMPILATFVQLFPNILQQVGILKQSTGAKPNLGTLIISAAVNILFLAKAPMAMALYFVTTTIYSSIEQIIYNIYVSRNSKKAAA